MDISLVIKRRAWLFGSIAWMIGIAERTFAALADGKLLFEEGIQLIVITLFMLAWFNLKPLSNWHKIFFSRGVSHKS